jgi:uncharacterized membrane protein HdeD (DUF308 family)
MSPIQIQRQRTGWDIVWGILLVVLGLVVLAHVVLATVVSVLFLGWFAVAAGVVELIAALFRIGRGGFWAAALSGGVLLVLGLMILRHPAAGALTLTLLAGALFLAGGITRIVTAFEAQASRALLLISGIASAVLGLIVLFDVWRATFTLLGTLLGIEALIDGVSLLVFGRVHVDRSGAGERRGTDAERIR